MINNLSQYFQFSDRAVRQFALNASPEALHQKLDAMADAMGDRAFKKEAARQIVERTQPQKAVPDVYADYRPLVRDGIEFFLSRIDRQRLIELVVDQLKQSPRTGTEERLLALAKAFPTLHKLGQIIARHPKIDPAVKQWLIHLENGDYGTPPHDLLAQIHDELERTGRKSRFDVTPSILSEASVGAVIPFHWRPSRSRAAIDGVFKILKPGIQSHLDEELAILEETAGFFEANRDRYPLKDFKFLEVFQDVREMLTREVDLAAEQSYLAEAAQCYSGMDAILIPQCFPFGSATITAMAYVKGPKITDARLDPEQRRRCAAILFEALVCRPLFSRDEHALFHGDPHAGNILAAFDPDAQRPRIGLLDWSLAGRLTKQARIHTVQLIQAVLKEDLSGIRRAVKALAKCTSMAIPIKRHRFRHQVLQWMRCPEFVRMTLIKRVFRLLELLTYEGFVFPAELMLFRKAIFTLEGVLHDLWPAFDMDAAVVQYMMGLMAQDAPKRCFNLLFPLADRPENYTSLISTMELQSLLVHQYAAAVHSSARTMFGSFMGLFGLSTWLVPATVPAPIEKRSSQRFLGK
jgi:ubiquinone biosynthesis protein